jgi:hypothetical protein
VTRERRLRVAAQILQVMTGVELLAAWKRSWKLTNLSKNVGSFWKSDNR